MRNKRTMLYFLAMAMAMSFNAKADDSYLPLQVGNTWRHFWAGKLPEDCNNPQSTSWCILEGGYTLSTIIGTTTINNRKYYLMAIYSGFEMSENAKLLHTDTLRAADNAVYAYSISGDRLWRNFAQSPASYGISLTTADTFSVPCINADCVPFYPCTYAVQGAEVYDTMPVIKERRAGQFWRIDATPECTLPDQIASAPSWHEYYCPGIGLVYAETSFDPYTGMFCALDSAFINGSPIGITSILPRNQMNARPQIKHSARAGSQTAYTLTGRRISAARSMNVSQQARRGLVVDMRTGAMVIR